MSAIVTRLLLKAKPLANGHARDGMSLYFDGGSLDVPRQVMDIQSFRRWSETDEFPKRGNVWWLCGRVWADMSKEQIFSHLAVKQEFFRMLGNLSKHECPGMLIPDGLLLSNFDADISGNPDATYISESTLNSDRVRLIEGSKSGYVEVQGTPDMVLEVVSDSSEEKDLVILMEAYWKAGIPEYWIVDARENTVRFDVWKHSAKGYRRTPVRHGWIVSAVFGKSFRLTVSERAGRKSFTLEVR